MNRYSAVTISEPVSAEALNIMTLTLRDARENRHSWLMGNSPDLLNKWAKQPMTELTLNIGKGLTPDICVYPKEKIRPNFFRDIGKFQEMPLLAIEIISPTQNIQELLEKASNLVDSGVKSVWTVEPYTRTVFVTTESGEELCREQELETEGIRVDFGDVFK